MEKSAKDVTGFFLIKNLFCDEYTFRVYDESLQFTDYKICAEDIEVSIAEDNTLSFYENGYNNRVDENSDVLGKKSTMKESPAGTQSGHFLYNIFNHNYWFRVYGEPKPDARKDFKDYEIYCDMEVKIKSGNLSFFEDEKGNRLSWASRIFSN